MKKYRFTILGSDAEKMWDFARSNQVNIHHVRTNNHTDPFDEIIYTYEGFMDKATFVAFRLTVPMRSTP